MRDSSGTVLKRRATLLAIANTLALQAWSASAKSVRTPKESSTRADDERDAINVLVTEDLLRDPASPVLGNPTGDVTMAEFFDYRCPYCKVMAPRLTELVSKDAGLKLVMKEYPVLSRESILAAKIGLVASRHGMYPAYHAGMFALAGPFDEERIMQVAQSAGLLPSIARSEMNGEDVLAELRRNLTLGDIIGVRGTPAFVIDGHVVPGATSITTLEELIATARKKQRS